MAERLKPRQYQKEGVRFGIESGVNFVGRWLNGDDMGLGKTGQAILFAKAMRGQRTLVVCPNSLKQNWRREIKKWLPTAPITVVSGTRKQKIKQIEAFRAGFLIVNYETIRAKPKEEADVENDPDYDPFDPANEEQDVEKLKFKGKQFEPTDLIEMILAKAFIVLLVDEGHRIANKDSLQARGVRFLCHGWPRAKGRKPQEGIPFLNILSGTFIRKGVADLWHPLHCVDKKKWSSFWKFAKTHANAHKAEYGWIVEEHATDPAKLEREIAPVLIRRMKEDHIDMPPVTYQDIYVELTGYQKAVYDQMEEEMMADLKGDEQVIAFNMLTKILRLKQIAVSTALVDPSEFPRDVPRYEVEDEEPDAKIAALREVILGTKQKIVVFSQFERAIQLVAEMLEREKIGYSTFTGTNVKTRDRDAALWQRSDHFQVLCATIQAGGEGQNWQEGSIVCLLDKMWTPADMNQAITRVYRPGQTKPVTVMTFKAVDTVEEWIEDLLNYRADLTAQIMALVRERALKRSMEK